MDPSYAAAIRRVFVQWYRDGLIYRGHRIINWCPRCTTALADDEVKHTDEVGHLWHLRYPLVTPVDGREYLVVATTRPETMLGDTGVAVNPHDERYQALLAAGAKIRLPLTGRVVPLVGDDYVDADFGTGVVKVTPAHDANDFEIGQRHDLEQINIFDEYAIVNENGGRFAGMTRYEAREAVVAALQEEGLLATVEEHEHAVGHCYRCDSTIEPWASEQWFVAMRPLAEPALNAVREGRVLFHPRRWENIYFHWMENIRDWCISRQLWWGHRIPVFYCDACGWTDASETDVTLCPHCGAATRQDEDVLDTWFSSQLWPFATADWPTPDSVVALARYYPTQVLSTARDIIFLWVARMVISSLYFMDGEVPFRDVIIHPTVLDKQGNIMSKSRGNGVDPMELIGVYGADAMRFGLAMQVTGSQDLKFDREKLAIYRNFATKIHNAARFVLINLGDFEGGAAEVGDIADTADGDVAATTAGACGCSAVAVGARVRPEARSAADRWILSRLAELLNDQEDPAREKKADNAYNFGAEARALYGFFWNEFCDWYIELAKGQLAQGGDARVATQRNLVFVLDIALRLLHPYMPFITESIWQSLPHGDSSPSLMVARWPFAGELDCRRDPLAERAIGLLIEVIGAVRSTRARYGLSPKVTLRVSAKILSKQAELDTELLRAQSVQIEQLANIEGFTAATDTLKPDQSSVVVTPALEIYIVLEGLVDFEAERQRLTRERLATQTVLEKLEKKLANPGFLAKAAEEVIVKTRQEAAEAARTLEQIDAQL
jgi:valyl-tRNA synthetase